VHSIPRLGHVALCAFYKEGNIRIADPPLRNAPYSASQRLGEYLLKSREGLV